LPQRLDSGQPASFPEKPKKERQDNAYEETRDDGEVKAEIALRVMDVARQTAQPAFAKACPDQQADPRNHLPSSFI
jgi:hypothetical protein